MGLISRVSSRTYRNFLFFYGPKNTKFLHFKNMPVQDTMYNGAQMNVPKELPDILKQFTKAAIRTQPNNLLDWSAAYFQALKNGEPLPVKTRYEMGASTGLTVGILNILNRQLGPPRQQPIVMKELRDKWQDLGLTEEALDKICVSGNFNLQEEDSTIDMEQFVSVAASDLVSSSASNNGDKSNASSELGQALSIVCELFTNDLEGGASRISINQFSRFFAFMANIANVSSSNKDQVLAYMQERADAQGGLVMPANFQSKDCPSF